MTGTGAFGLDWRGWVKYPTRIRKEGFSPYPLVRAGYRVLLRDGSGERWGAAVRKVRAGWTVELPDGSQDLATAANVVQMALPRKKS